MAATSWKATRVLPFSTVAADTAVRLAGTAPVHRSYILLHRAQSPRTFPSRLSSPLQRALSQRARKWQGLVNFAWTPGDRSDSADAWRGSEDEVYSASAFAPGKNRLFIPSVSMENLDEISDRIANYVVSPPSMLDAQTNALHLYVCTHGARDCRCGEFGSAVADALQEEVQRRREVDSAGPYANVVVGEVGHVGGHQHAANMLVFPSGEWLGMLRPEHVLTVLNTLMLRSPFSFAQAASAPPLLPQHWRGRMGLTRDEQIRLHDSLGGRSSDSAL